MRMDEILNATEFTGDRTDLVAIWDHLQAVIDRDAPEAAMAGEALRGLRG